MPESEIFEHFRHLCDDLPEIREKVAMLASPNTDDDRVVKFAILGYSYHQPIELWSRDEIDFVANRRREVTGFDQSWVEFVCLATGYLLGLYQTGRCNEVECALFEALLPGFMWQHAEQFTG